jgi:hypothetical protein
VNTVRIEVHKLERKVAEQKEYTKCLERQAKENNIVMLEYWKEMTKGTLA